MLKEFFDQRKQMVQRQLRLRGISDPRILSAFESIPRHLFVPEDSIEYAYDDCPIPIGYGQTISQPYIVAYMTQALKLIGNERVLEVGAGSGYQAAILSRLVREVHAIELIPALADRAARLLANLDISNVHIHTADGSIGWNASAPYDAIIVSAAAPKVPGHLLDQLSDQGRMIIPIGDRGFQILELWRRTAQGFDHESLLPVAFVPLRGKVGVS